MATTATREPRKPIRVKRQVDRGTEFQTIAIPRSLAQECRRFLLQRELETGIKMNLARFIAEAVSDKISRLRAENI